MRDFQFPARSPVSGHRAAAATSHPLGTLAAIETLFLIPVVIVTFLLQNQLLRGVTFGTIKR